MKTMNRSNSHFNKKYENENGKLFEGPEQQSKLKITICKDIKTNEQKQKQLINFQYQKREINKDNTIFKEQSEEKNFKNFKTQHKPTETQETQNTKQRNQKPTQKLHKLPTPKHSNITNMVERFVEALHINDSGAFDASFEIKRIPETPQRMLRHRCVTELDRESLARFVRDLEARQREQQQRQQQQQEEKTKSPSACRRNSSSALNTTPKGSPYFCRKAKALYQSVFNSGNTSGHSSRSNSPRALQTQHETSTPDTQSTHSDLSSAGDSHTHLNELEQTEVTDVAANADTSFQRTQSERSSYRSAVKVLQFFSGKKKCQKSKRSKSDADAFVTRSNNASPAPLRAIALGCQPLPHSDTEDNNEDAAAACDYFEYEYEDDANFVDFEAEDEHDDGISSASSNLTQSSSSHNYTPDSSFEMHSPLVPTFKVTPPQMCKASRNPAYEFVRFMRGSFHAKHASVTKLRRSISDPDAFQEMDFATTTRDYQRATAKSSVKKGKSVKEKEAARVVTTQAAVKAAGVIRNPNLPTNASPFRRAWGQSSFRTPRTDKHSPHHHQQTQLQQQSGQHQHLSPLVRLASSMTASDNDVYIKSMHHGGAGSGYHDELKQARSQHQIATAAAALVAARNANAAQIKTAPQTALSNTTTNGGNNNNNNNNGSSHLKLPTVKTTPPTIENSVTGVAAWGTAFEKLLDDPAGMHTFGEFLKKEFSGENIYFWTACERFRALESSTERVAQAIAIFSKHLANGALEPVNVDSQARNLTQEKLQTAEPDIFAPAQKQIFNLMKFDSYQRFIRSDMYKSCLEAEEKRQPLPYKAEDLDELLRTPAHHAAQVNATTSKLKKSASNAEDRCRKSLLPWHRKTSSSKAPRDAAELASENKHSTSKLALLSSHSLKVAAAHNSQSDIHSSRSSLSSFDGLPGASILPGTCRVILTDASTTMVQVRANETVVQLVERLLEKRGLTYQYYDVVAKGTTKSIDLQTSSQTLVGKDVLIEQRVSFKLDLPDRKVISVKSKPKKQLHEVVRPILHKYNYDYEAVQVVIRETQEPVDLSLTVTYADGQRLQAVWLKPPPLVQSSDYQNGNGCAAKVPKSSTTTKSVSFPSQIKPANAGVITLHNANGNSVLKSHPMQSALDEITNKVFTELMQGKVEAASAEKTQQLTTTNCKTNDLTSLKSDDCASETSSVFERVRRRDTNIAGLKSKLKKRSTSSQQSEETSQGTITVGNGQMNAPTTGTTVVDIKKPIIAKLKAGVKLQMPERVAENQDELLEGLKRAQLARLEDQRGTEINFELPDFLKNKENLQASKLRKARANLSPINKSYNVTPTPVTQHNTTSATTTTTSPTNNTATTEVELPTPQLERPQPAPRFSITNKLKTITTVSPAKPEEEAPPPNTIIEARQLQYNTSTMQANTSNSSIESEYGSATVTSCYKGPPPLPPKPKVLPIKPSNWGAAMTNISSSSTTTSPTTPSMSLPSLLTAAPRNYTTVGLTNSVTTLVEDAASTPALLLHVASSSKHCAANEIIPRKTHLSIAAEQQTSARCAYLEEPSSSFV
ncbi:regulator of G-protein signaling loco isoform X2 [Eurosta solidaginis]|uniref:regulator of G-protein signaling loco isoform X2 n=1 Tax=Eurosta solidaginis TaxID=178769 RepID=UPI003531618D